MMETHFLCCRRSEHDVSTCDIVEWVCWGRRMMSSSRKKMWNFSQQNSRDWSLPNAKMKYHKMRIVNCQDNVFPFGFPTANISNVEHCDSKNCKALAGRNRSCSRMFQLCKNQILYLDYFPNDNAIWEISSISTEIFIAHSIFLLFFHIHRNTTEALNSAEVTGKKRATMISMVSMERENSFKWMEVCYFWMFWKAIYIWDNIEDCFPSFFFLPFLNPQEQISCYWRWKWNRKNIKINDTIGSKAINIYKRLLISRL